MAAEYDVVIIGGGAAGLSAAIYATRAQLKTLIVEQLAPGGQILNTSDIENYPGFPDGVLGPDIGLLMHKQSENTGTLFAFDTVIDLKVDGEVKVVVGEEREYTTKTIIITTGGEHNKLGVPGEEEFAGRGVTYCATCDGNFFAGEDTVVVGGGDAAIDEGMYLSRIVRSLTVVHRRDQLRATKVLQERAFSTENVNFKFSHAVKEIRGSGGVDRVLLEDLKSGQEYEYPTAAVFIYIGFPPQLLLPSGQASPRQRRPRHNRHPHGNVSARRLRCRRRPSVLGPPARHLRRRRYHRSAIRVPLHHGGLTKFSAKS